MLRTTGDSIGDFLEYWEIPVAHQIERIYWYIVVTDIDPGDERVDIGMA